MDREPGLLRALARGSLLVPWWEEDEKRRPTPTYNRKHIATPTIASLKVRCPVLGLHLAVPTGCGRGLPLRPDRRGLHRDANRSRKRRREEVSEGVRGTLRSGSPCFQYDCGVQMCAQTAEVGTNRAAVGQVPWEFILRLLVLEVVRPKTSTRRAEANNREIVGAAQD